MKKFLYSVRCAGLGIGYALATERNIRIQLLIFVVVLAFALVLDIPKNEIVVLLAMSALLLALELVNTAVERLADRMTTQYDPQIGVVKDVMAGAVLVAAIFSLVIGILIFYDPLLKIIQR